MKLSIKLKDPRLFIAASVGRGTLENRLILNGVQIRRHSDGGLIYKATNGHHLVIVYDPIAEVTGDLPGDGVVIAGKFPKPSYSINKKSVTINLDGSNGEFVVQSGYTSSTVQIEVLDGKFPMVDEVYQNADEQFERCGVTANPDNIERACSIANMLNNEGPITICPANIHLESKYSIRILFPDSDIGENIFYLGMPFQDTEADLSFPKWMTKDKKEVKRRGAKKV